MYLPYVRGKQFELLAVKEMASYLGEHNLISPVIEPVRERVSALTRCLDELSLFNVATTVILNPEVGQFAVEPDSHTSVLKTLLDCAHYEHLRLGVIVNAATDVEALRAAISSTDLSHRPVDLIHREFSRVQGLENIVGNTSRHLVADKSLARRYRPRLPGGLIKLTNPFPRRKTNLEYVGAPATLFTDDNIYFAEDGFLGFGDYATIGEEFSEGGSSPRAVVIHLTYPDSEDGTIWIQHFCSDSNADTADTAGKFGEAVKKLVAFCEQRGHSNPAVRAFKSYHDSGSFPGLGMVKKLSIQNHLYVLGDSMSEAK